jgi:hypothetical protein
MTFHRALCHPPRVSRGLLPLVCHLLPCRFDSSAFNNIPKVPFESTVRQALSLSSAAALPCNPYFPRVNVGVSTRTTAVSYYRYVVPNTGESKFLLTIRTTPVVPCYCEMSSTRFYFSKRPSAPSKEVSSSDFPILHIHR